MRAELQYDFSAMVRGIQEKHEESEIDLYCFMRALCIRELQRNIGADYAEDKLHDAYIFTLRSIRAGKISAPAALPGYVQITVRRKTIDHIRHQEFIRKYDRMLERHEPKIERELIVEEATRSLWAIINKMSPSRRDLMTRIYRHEQEESLICREMSLTATQFRLWKSRAKKDLLEQMQPVYPGNNRAGYCVKQKSNSN